MKIKIVMLGEQVNLPETKIGWGIGAVNVWCGGNGFTSAMNDIGSQGAFYLETPAVDLGDVGEEKQTLFTHLHGRVVRFDVKVNRFVLRGGIARIGITVPVEDGGTLVDKKIEFVADDCTGLSVLENDLSFSVTMLMMPEKVAQLGDSRILSDDEVVAMADSAQGQEQVAQQDSPQPAEGPSTSTEADENQSETTAGEAQT